MNLGRIRQGGLQLYLSLMRSGWLINGAAILLVAGALAWGVGIPYLTKRLAVQQSKLLLLQKTTDSAPPPVAPAKVPVAQLRLREFYAALGEQHYPEQQIKTLFAIAAKNGLVLSQAEYKATYDSNGRFHTYRIQFPLRGQYPVIRQFCEQVLLAIPFASLDDISFKREAITNPQLETKLSFTLYLNTEPNQAGNSKNSGRKVDAE